MSAAFSGEVSIPAWNLHNNVAVSVGHSLTCEARLKSRFGSVVELVELGVDRFVAAFEAFFDENVAGATGADPAASVVNVDAMAHGNF